MMQILSESARPPASIIIPCKNEGANVKITADSILAATPLDSIEMIIVDDQSTDGCCRFLVEDAAYAGIKLLSPDWVRHGPETWALQPRWANI